MTTSRPTDCTSELPAPGARRPYRRPRLAVYGQIRSLTAGGSGLELEPNPGKGGQPLNKRP